MFGEKAQEANLIRRAGTTTTHYDTQVFWPVCVNRLGSLFCTTRRITLHGVMSPRGGTSELIGSLAADEWSPYCQNSRCDKA